MVKELEALEKHGQYPAEYDALDTYNSFYSNLNIGLFQAEHEEWHQVMNQLVLATKDGMRLLESDSQDECLSKRLRNELDGEIDEKLTRYIARTVDRFFGALGRK